MTDGLVYYADLFYQYTVYMSNISSISFYLIVIVNEWQVEVTSYCPQIRLYRNSYH